VIARIQEVLGDEADRPGDVPHGVVVQFGEGPPQVPEIRHAGIGVLLAERHLEPADVLGHRWRQRPEQLVDQHGVPVPELFFDRQIRTRVEQSLRAMNADGVDLKSLKLDWAKVKETQRDKAVREVRASLLLERIAEREAIHATRDEVDKEVERLARMQREPVAALRIKFEKDGTMGRIAHHIQTEKTLTFLFEQARKTA